MDFRRMLTRGVLAMIMAFCFAAAFSTHAVAGQSGYNPNGPDDVTWCEIAMKWDFPFFYIQCHDRSCTPTSGCDESIGVFQPDGTPVSVKTSHTGFVSPKNGDNVPLPPDMPNAPAVANKARSQYRE